MRILVEPLVVVIAAGKRPAPIPNLEAKPASADGTAPGRVWESRTPPQQPSQMVGPLEHLVPTGPTTLRIPTRKATGGQPARPVKRPQGCLFAYAPLVTTSTCQHMPRCEQTPRIRTQHRKARAWRVIAPSAHTSANTHLMRSFARSASASLVASSRCSSKRSFE